MTRTINVSSLAITAALAASLALSACQKPAATAAATDPNAAAPMAATTPAAPYPAAAPASAPTVRYIDRPSRRDHEDEQAYAARLASDAAYQARLQQAAADQARSGQQQADRFRDGPPPPPPGDAYRAGMRAGANQGFDQGRDQQARLDAYQAQAARQGAGQARVDEARRELADAYHQAAETPDPNRRAQIVGAAKERLAAAMAATGR